MPNQPTILLDKAYTKSWGASSRDEKPWIVPKHQTTALLVQYIPCIPKLSRSNIELIDIYRLSYEMPARFLENLPWLALVHSDRRPELLEALVARCSKAGYLTKIHRKLIIRVKLPMWSSLYIYQIINLCNHALIHDS